MNVDDFIKKNPFPKNGTSINNDLIKKIQDPSQESNYKNNCYKLLKNNARIIYVIWRQYSYNKTLADIMSFVYEGIRTTSKEYKLGSNKPYYAYLVTYVRGLLQKDYNYKESIIHVPVMKKKKVELDIEEISTLSDFSFISINKGSESISEDLDDLLFLYERQNLPQKIREDFEILKLSKSMNIKEISERTNIGVGKVRNIIKRTIPRLQTFYKKHILEN